MTRLDIASCKGEHWPSIPRFGDDDGLKDDDTRYLV